jgi:hypothetical protein
MLRWTALAAIGIAGCGPGGSAGVRTDDPVVLDTGTELAKRQHRANLDFARSYQAGCAPSWQRPRVVVSGFGRFLSIQDNASGRLVSTLVPGLAYPETSAPAASEIDPPGPQLAVTQAVVEIDGIGEVDLCGLVLPVYWDLAAVILAREVEAFEPDLVIMNGVAGERQPVWLELGGVNRAMRAPDGSGILEPHVAPGEEYAPLIQRAPEWEQQRGLVLSYHRVQAALRRALEERGAITEGGARLDEIAQGVLLAGYPRASNTYLCNNTSYVVGYLMDYPWTKVPLLTSSADRSELIVEMGVDLWHVPRVFVHWPSTLAGAHLTAGAELLEVLIGEQLAALFEGDWPIGGSNDLADVPPDL